jgi:hypothetical protein
LTPAQDLTYNPPVVTLAFKYSVLLGLLSLDKVNTTEEDAFKSSSDGSLAVSALRIALTLS